MNCASPSLHSSPPTDRLARFPERKVACDRRSPACQKCTISGRTCHGYGLRLSWPRKGDLKRCVVAKNNPSSQHRRLDFINVYVSDVELVNLMKHSDIAYYMTQLPEVKRNPRWVPMPMNTSQFELFSYYLNNIAHQLACPHGSPLETLIFRMTFSEGSLASVALLSSIFALSSFQQQDMVSAAEYRRRALNAVWASAAQQATAQDVLRRIVCMNFLAIYEQIACPESPDEWTSSIFHSKTDIISVFPLGRMYHGDLSLILDWTYHYDLLFKFNMGRYKNMSQKLLKCAKKKHIMLARSYGTNQSQIVPTLGCSLEIFHTITSITDAGLLIELDGSTFAESFDKLERRLKYAVQDFHVDTKNTIPWLERETDHVRDIAELYRLAALIYLHRIGRRTLKSVHDIQPFMSSSLDILNRLETCERTLPLFVIGCEAQSDEARSVILRLIGSTELAFFQCSNMTRLRGFLERFWALDDLDDLEESSYSEKITAVLSSGQSLPPFS